MIKYATNAFLAVKIGFANEVANICERVGADAPEVMAGIGLDARIGSRFLNPGMGWGGNRWCAPGASTGIRAACWKRPSS
jgi:UDPglucose 6-dehydrogenase